MTKFDFQLVKIGYTHYNVSGMTLFRWFDFTDKQFLIMFSIVTTAIVLIILFILSFTIIHNSLRKYEKRIKQESITTRIFILNVKENRVVYFNRADLKDKKEMDLSHFYSHFHENDSERVKQWIYEICVGNPGVDEYLEADVLVNRGKATYFSLLKLLKYDREKGTLHLESHILKFITPMNYENNKKDALSGVVKRSVMDGVISKSKSLRGFTFDIRFFHIRQKALSNDKIERYMIMTLKNEVYPFASDPKIPRQIVDETGSEILLFDVHMENRDQAMRLATSLAHSLRKSIGVNGYSESVSFAIGIVENKQYYQDFDSIVTKAQEACINAQQNGNEIYLYQKSSGPMIKELDKYAEEIHKLTKPNSMRYLFRPIIDVQRHRVLGYFEYVRAYNSPFNNFSEMSKYAAKVGQNRELFATVARAVIPKFVSERPNITSKLFFSVSMLDIDHMVDILPQVPQIKDVRLVLVFEEQEVNENSSQLELLNSSLKKFHQMGYELALLLQDKNLLLDPSVYTNFDYFVAGASMLSEIKKNNRIRLSIHTLIEQLLKFKKPIIATDLEGWQAIELIIKSGVNYISSEAVAASNDMLLPVDAKKMDKLVQMNKNFR